MIQFDATHPVVLGLFLLFRWAGQKNMGGCFSCCRSSHRIAPSLDQVRAELRSAKYDAIDTAVLSVAPWIAPGSPGCNKANKAIIRKARQCLQMGRASPTTFSLEQLETVLLSVIELRTQLVANPNTPRRPVPQDSMHLVEDSSGQPSDLIADDENKISSVAAVSHSVVRTHIA